MLPRLHFLALLLVALVGHAGLVPVAFADGKIFRTQTADLTSVPMPDQRAALFFDGTHQALVIESGFTAADAAAAKGETNAGYAWVVPLPAVAEISEATPGTFPSLRALFAPRVEQRSYPVAGLLGVLVLSLVMIAAYAGRWRWVLVVVGVGALVMLVLPALGTARAISSTPTAAVSVLSRTHLGSREVTQVTGSADALRTWLTAQGVAISPAVSRVVDDYARDGWVFAAITLAPNANANPNPDATTTALSSPPIIFRFPTKEPIYPMRLTGADAAIPLDVELFVFASGTATADGFDTLASAPVLPTSRHAPPQWSRSIDPVAEAIEVSHPTLAPLVASIPHATHLRGVLAPLDMTRDVRLTVGTPRTFGRIAYTRDAALNLALEVAIWALVVAILVVAIWERAKIERRRLRSRLFLGSCAAALAAFVATRLLLPTVELADGNRSLESARHDLRYLASSPEMDGLSLEVIRARVRDEMTRRAAAHEDAVVLEEGDRPGDYQLVDDGDSNLHLVWIDPAGRARRDPMLVRIGPPPLHTHPDAKSPNAQ